MHLFLGMLFLFVMIAVVTWQAMKTQIDFKVKQIQRMQDEHKEWTELQQNPSTPDPNDRRKKPEPVLPSQRQIDFASNHKEFGGVLGDNYERFREYFIQEVSEYVRTDDGRKLIDEDFCMARYLSICLDEIIGDLTHFHPTTWVMALTMYGVFGSIAYAAKHQTGHAEDIILQLFFASIGPIVSTVVCLWAHCCLRDIGKRCEEASTTGKKAEGPRKMSCGEQVRLELHLARLLQACSFVTCYSATRLIFASRLYTHGKWGGRDGTSMNWWEELILVVVYFLLWCYQVYIVSKTVLYITVLLAIPPYVDNENLAIAKKVAVFSKSDMDMRLKKAKALTNIPEEKLKELMEKHAPSPVRQSLTQHNPVGPDSGGIRQRDVNGGGRAAMHTDTLEHVDERDDALAAQKDGPVGVSVQMD
jgi:hypothetical protein